MLALIAAATRGASTAAKWAVRRGKFFCVAMRCGVALLASASRATQHFPSCTSRSRHTLRLAFRANDALVQAPASVLRSRGGGLRKTFLQVAQSAVDRFAASPYSPPTHDGH